jgi:hypothetical protein
MARNRFGTDITGRTGSMNKNNGGMTYMKNGVQRVRVVPVNPQTALQSQTRSVLSSFTSKWGTLTEPQRKEWNDGAKDPFFFVQDAFTGTARPMNSGKALFIAINYNLNQENGSLDAPTVLAIAPTFIDTPDNFSITSVVADASSDSLTVNYTQSGTSESLLVRSTPAVSPGNMRITSVAGKLRDSDAVLGASPADASHPDPFTGQTGQKVFWQIFAISTTTGKKRLIATGTSIVQA